VSGPAESGAPLGTRAALNELGRLLLVEHTGRSVLQRTVDLVQHALPAAADVSITVIRGEHPTTAASTGRLAADLDEIQYARGHGPCLDAALSGQVTRIDDARTEDRWPDFVPRLLAHGALSTLAVPVPAPHLTAGLNTYARSPRAFTDDDRDALVEFAALAGAALTNVDALEDARQLAENLQKAMDSRAVIEQAKGILVERYKVTPEQAFRLVADTSMRTNRKVRDLAEHLVLTGELTGSPWTLRPPPAASS
jgi:GAF domain-containing protein